MTTMYTNLSDASHLDSRYGAPGATVFYCRPEFGRDLRMGSEFCREQGIALPSRATLAESHVRVGTVGASDPNAVYRLMQGENWSPNGEARNLIRGLGLCHTTMTVGDCVEVGGQLLLVDEDGFTAL